MWDRLKLRTKFIVAANILIILLVVVSASPVEFRQQKTIIEEVKQQDVILAIGRIYRRPLAHLPSTLDPAKINDIYGRTIAQQIFDGLVKFNESLDIKPAIAKSWKSSRDGLVWTFYLREGAKFHHGREVTAEDFVYSFTRILDPKTGSGTAGLLMNVKGARDFVSGRVGRVSGLRTLDKYTLEITLEEPSGPFVSTVAVGPFKVVPREVVEKDEEKFGRNPIGTGPFRFVERRANHIILEASDAYFEGRPYLDKIVYKIFPGDRLEDMFVAFQKGELEDAPFPAYERDRLIDSKDFQFVRRSILGIRFLAFNTDIWPLSDRRIRQAITHAIDRERIAQNIYKNQHPPATGIVPPGTYVYDAKFKGLPLAYGYDPKLNGLPFAPEKSRELLVSAGFPEGKGLPTLHVWSSAKFDEAVAELEAIIRYLGEVGIKAEIQYNTDWPRFKKDVYDGKLPIFRYSWYGMTPDPENFLYRLFHSQSVDNFTRFHNHAINRLLLRATAEPDPIKRVNLFREVERQILSEAPILPLGYYSYERVFQPYVKGIKVSALGDPYIPMKDIWLEKTATPDIRW